MKEKTIKEVIEAYAHDYRNMSMSMNDLNDMLWKFWREQEEVSRSEHLKQFMSRIDSHGFYEWYTK